jgi:hypothetical protein
METLYVIALIFFVVNFLMEQASVAVEKRSHAQ